MKNEAKRIFRSIVRVIIILGIIIAIGSVLFKVFLTNPLGDLENETGDIPTYVVYGNLHLPNKTIDISRICRKQNENYSLGEIFGVVDGKVYCACSENVKPIHNWLIISIDLETSELSVCCRFLDVNDYYDERPYDEYINRNGYYHEGKIVLNDYETVLTYEIEGGEVCEFAFDSYEFPKRTVYREGKSDQTMALHLNGEIYNFTLQEMAEKSNGISAIYALRNKKGWDDFSYLVSFLSPDTVQVINDEIYSFECILNYWGTSIGIILKYDQGSNVWQFVTQCIVGDNISYHCYLVENIP